MHLLDLPPDQVQKVALLLEDAEDRCASPQRLLASERSRVVTGGHGQGSLKRPLEIPVTK